MFLCYRKVKWVAKPWLMMDASGVYIEDYMIDCGNFYQPVIMNTAQSGFGNSWVFCHVFLSWCLLLFSEWLRAVLLSWVKIGGMDKRGRGMRSHRFFYPGAGGVERVPWTFGPQFSFCEIRHFWIFFQHFWRVNAGNKSAKMVIGPTSIFFVSILWRFKCYGRSSRRPGQAELCVRLCLKT